MPRALHVFRFPPERTVGLTVGARCDDSRLAEMDDFVQPGVASSNARRATGRPPSFFEEQR